MWSELGMLCKKNALGFGIILVIFFLLGYFVCDYGWNRSQAEYSYFFETETEEVSYLKDPKFFKDVFAQIDEYNTKISSGIIEGKKISYAKIDYEKMLETTQIVSLEEEYCYRVKTKYFPSLVRTGDGTVRSGILRCQNYLDLVFSYSASPIYFQKMELNFYQNPWLVGTYSALGCACILMIALLIFVWKKEPSSENIFDNQTVFATPFHKKYWKDSLKCFQNVRQLCFISMLFSMMMVCKMIPIPSGFGSLGIGLTYLIFSIVAMLYGPVCGIVIGFFSDILGFFFFQTGSVFFFGYTLDAMLAGLIYGLCFFQTKITFTKCLLARLIVNLGVNVLLGSFWWKIVYQLNTEGFQTYLLTISLPKNIVYLLPQSILLYLVFKAVCPVFVSFGLISEKVRQNISLF